MIGLLDLGLLDSLFDRTKLRKIFKECPSSEAACRGGPEMRRFISYPNPILGGTRREVDSIHTERGGGEKDKTDR